MSSVSTDGKDGHGLKLEKVGPFFQGLMLYLQNHQKILWLVLLDDICLKSSK